jgi:PiT family inorganic phosphate transporter
MPESQISSFIEHSQAASKVVETKAAAGPAAFVGDPRPVVTSFITARHIDDATFPALAALITDIAEQVQHYGSIAKIPAAKAGNTRNDMYLVSEAIRLLQKDNAAALTAKDTATLVAYKKNLDSATKFIPDWVKIAVAIALGLGTMIGWKRIVVTVGEKIGKPHLTYSQGAAAELVAMGTIAAADSFGLPVSTTHVLSSGVAGTMAANGSGVQMSTIRSLALAWVLTLPCAIALSATLFFFFRQFERFF